MFVYAPGQAGVVCSRAVVPVLAFVLKDEFVSREVSPGNVLDRADSDSKASANTMKDATIVCE
jgi:hypothetical protein